MKNLMKSIALLLCFIIIQPLFAQNQADYEYAVYEDVPLYIDIIPIDYTYDYVYTWYEGGNPISIATTSVPELFFDTITPTNVGMYRVDISDAIQPGVVLESRTVDITLQVLETDSIGGEYNSHEYIVKFEPGTSQAVKDAIRTSHNGILRDTCLCDIELWYIDDLIIDPENKKESIASEPEVESVDFNYVVEADAHATTTRDNHNSTVRNVRSAKKLEKQNTSHTLVALIDTGVDQGHMDLQNIFWTNPNEVGGNLDNDGNCLEQDTMGYDFIDKDAVPADTHWKHATHLAGLVDDISNEQAEIMNLKIFGNQTKSTLFPAVCATYYAAVKDAEIINMSWGWQGLPSDILKRAITYAGENCGALVVCSAGNDGMNNDSFPHYPSGYSLENIIEVASIDVGGDWVSGKTPYSNYGSQVDVAARGNWISTIPGNSYEEIEGTSMSAAVISGMLASMYASNSTATWRELKDCLLGSAYMDNSLQEDTLNGLWFSPEFMDYDALFCIGNVMTPDTCPTVVKIYVDDTAVGLNNGTSWENAFTDLQDGIKAISYTNYGTIYMAEGIYKPTTTASRGKFFTIERDMTIYGAYPNGGGTPDGIAYPTILSGDIDNDGTLAGNSFHVVQVKNDITASLHDLIIEGGNANNANSFARARGGGIFVNGANLYLDHCKVRNNKAIYGGGIFATLAPDVNIGNSEFTNNEAGNGSALYHSNETNMYIWNSKIMDNNSTTRCAIEINNSLYTRIENSLIANNASQNANAIAFIATNRDQVCDIYNTTIIGETQDKNLITMQVGFGDQLDVNIYNSIIAHQDVSFTKAFKDYNNNILNLSTNNCYIQGNSVIGMQSNNLYSDTDGDLLLNDNYSLAVCSPAIDAGDNSYTLNLFTETDLNGYGRIFNGTVDMGAFENQFIPCGVIGGGPVDESETDVILLRTSEPEEINLYPNPTEGKVYISGNMDGFSISVYDILGKEIMLHEKGRIMDFGSLTTGTYILFVYNGGQLLKVEKMIKN